MPAPNRVLLAANAFDPQRWKTLLSARREVVLEPDRADDPTIAYAVVWQQRPGLMESLPNLKAIFSVGAGVDHLVSDPRLPDVPVIRVVAADLTRHMTDYVVWRVMDHHRQGVAYRAQQGRACWHPLRQPSTSEVAIGIMGLGELGRAAARALLALGFKVHGWNRRGGRVGNIEVFHGPEGLPKFLNATDILVVLLPLTPVTRGLIDYRLLSQLRRNNALGGAVLVNAGRGGLQSEEDILRALDDGVLKEASLDVFEQEPLPASSPIWNDPRICLTPHVAASSNADQLVGSMLDQMDACDRGEPLRNVVDRKSGY